MPKLGGGLSGDVPIATKEELAQKLRQAIAFDPAVLTKHLLADEEIIDSLVQEADDAEAIAQYWLSRIKKRADLFDLTVELNDDTSAIDLGDTITVAHPRYGLPALTGDDLEEGHPGLVVGVAPNSADAEVTFTILMTAGSMANLVTHDGDFLVDHDGNHLITSPD